MKRILIISYFFPPCNLVGAQRPYSWYKHLAKFGLYPVVLTRHWNKEIKTLADASLPDTQPIKIERHAWGEVHYLPYKGSLRDRFLLRNGDSYAFIRKFLTVCELFSQYISILGNPYRFFIKYAESLIATDNYCAVAVSANPFPLFAIGHILSKKKHIPWIADYRDDWTTNDFRKKGGLLNTILFSLEKNREKKWLSNNTFFTAVTAFYIEKISASIHKKGHLVLNGFDDVSFFEKISVDHTLTLLYAGTVYHKQDFSIMANGIKNFLEKNPSIDVKIIFAGAEVDGIIPENIVFFKSLLSGSRVYIDVLPRANQTEFNLLMNQSHALFTVPYGASKGIVSAKLFYYLSTGKPIIMGGSDDDVMQELIDPYSLGYISRSTEELGQILATIIEKYKHGNFAPTSEDLAYVHKFKRENQAKIFAELILKNIQPCAE